MKANVGLKSRPSLRALTGLLIGTMTMLFTFQNCGDQDGSDDLSVLSDSPDIQAFKAAPYPFDNSFNQIAYSTCAMASSSKPLQEDLDSPFFTIRVGSYDNHSLATRFPQLISGSAYQEPEKTYRLKAGVGLRKDYVDYIKSKFASRLAAQGNSPDAFRKLLRDSVVGGGVNVRPLSALIFRLRSAQGFAWEANDSKSFLAPLTDVNTANQLVAGMDMGTYGMERVNYLTGTGDLTQRADVSSVNVAKDESQRDFIRSQMGTNLQIVAGFADADGDTSVFGLKSPGDNNKTLYGRVYRLGTSRNWPGRIDYAPNTAGVQTAFQGTSVSDDFVNSVQEVDTSTANERDLTATEGQQWDCFALMVVRDTDRRDPTTNQLFDPDYDLSLWTGNKKNKYYDFQADPTSPIVPGVRVACPSQEIGDGTKPGTLNYTVDGGVARMRLEIARRFLPADLWDINTNPEYMCAVPRSAAQGFGQCYAAGDFNASQYVMYTQTGTELGKAVQCGINPTTGQLQKECPAFINICYRKQ